MAYATPPITTITSYGPIASYSLVQQAPALLTQFIPPSQCSTDWYWDTAALRSSSTVFSDSSHNTAWSTCQPYNAPSATYSAGVCPQQSEFKTATKVYWDGVDEAYYIGACCGTSSTLSSYTVDTSETRVGCFATPAQSSVVATMVQENLEPTPVTSKGPVTVIAEPLYMVWHSGDTSLHPASDAASLQAVMGMAIASSKVGPITTPTGSSALPLVPETPSLSKDAIIGIAVGFSFCLSVIALLGYFAIARRRAKTLTPPNESWTDDRAMSEQAGAPAMRSETSAQQWPSEAGDSGIKLSSFVEHNAADSPSRRSGDDWLGVEQKTLLR